MLRGKEKNKFNSRYQYLYRRKKVSHYARSPLFLSVYMLFSNFSNRCRFRGKDAVVRLFNVPTRYTASSSSFYFFSLLAVLRGLLYMNSNSHAFSNIGGKKWYLVWPWPARNSISSQGRMKRSSPLSLFPVAAAPKCVFNCRQLLSAEKFSYCFYNQR